MANKKDLANGLIGAALTSAATTLVLQAGYGDSMPAVPFFLTITPAGQLSTRGNSEIVNVTARTGDTLTIERAQKETTARSFSAGDIVSNGIYIENSTEVGDIFMSLRATPAAGRLFMAGGTFNKADYPLLYKCVSDNAAYGTTTSTAFTLADMRERMPFGKSSNSPFTTLGSTGGSKTHAHPITLGLPVYYSEGLHEGTNAGIYIKDDTSTVYAVNTNIGSNTRQRNSSTTGAQTGFAHDGFARETTGNTKSANSLSPYILVNYEVIAG